MKLEQHRGHRGEPWGLIAQMQQRSQEWKPRGCHLPLEAGRSLELGLQSSQLCSEGGQCQQLTEGPVLCPLLPCGQLAPLAGRQPTGVQSLGS